METEAAEWRICAKRGEFKAIGDRFGVGPIVARVLRNRDLETDEEIEKYLYGGMDDMYDPMLMKDMDKACSIMSSKLLLRKSIRVVGDYDCDGVTSSYILVDGLRSIAGRLERIKSDDEVPMSDIRKMVEDRISYDIPHRVADGYGINVRIVEKAAADGVDTIITCDNGIAAVEAIKRAKELGMTFIVTDHHLPNGLPPADAVIDPHCPGDRYPFKDICGAVVAYKFIQALHADMQMSFPYERYLDIAAIGTVVDVMPLKDENRIIVKEGLRLAARTRNMGLRALMDAASLNLERGVSSANAGFVIGPVINTQGRLYSAKGALRLLLSERSERYGYDEDGRVIVKNPGNGETAACMTTGSMAETSGLTLTDSAAADAASGKAVTGSTAADAASGEAVTDSAAADGTAVKSAPRIRTMESDDAHIPYDATVEEMAAQMVLDNNIRKEITSHFDESQISGVDDDVIVVYVEGLDESLAGLVAGTIKERLYRPTIVFTDSGNPDKSDIYKGSGRSVEGYDMFEHINRHRDMLAAFGGHALAAGMSIEKSKLDEFRNVLNADLRQEFESGELSRSILKPVVMIDVAAPLKWMTSVPQVKALMSLEPFGTANPSPLFAQANLEITGVRLLGEGKLMLIYVTDEEGKRFTLKKFKPEFFESDIKKWFGDTVYDKILKGVSTGVKLDIAYETTLNTYYANESVDFMVKYYQPS